METVFFNKENLPLIIEKIKKDIRFLNQIGIYDSNIFISIPTFIKGLLEAYLKNETPNNGSFNFNCFYGAKIVPGYNNQICVFYDMAMPSAEQCVPIQLVFHETLNKFTPISL